MSEIAWQKSDTLRNDAGKFSADFDYIIVYSKNAEWTPNRIERPEEFDQKYKNPDGDDKPWFNAGPTAPGALTHQGMVYGIQTPITGEVHYPLKGRHWAWAQESIYERVSEYCSYEYRNIGDMEKRAEICGIDAMDVKDDVCALMVFGDIQKARESAIKRHSNGKLPAFYFTGKNGEGYPGKKTYRPDVGVAPQTWWPFEKTGSSRSARAEIKALFSGEIPFSTPKPERLLERIIHIASNPGDIVLDCFAGSGTTAAVAQKMGRRWVTCELLSDTFNRYTLPRLTKVVNNEDAGGITRTKGEHVAADGVELPKGVSADDAADFTKVLNKLIADNDELKKDATVKLLKTLSKTKRTKEIINWHGGGGFQVAHLSRECFDYNPERDLVMLTDAAKGDTLVKSIAANLEFRLLDSANSVFDGKRGRSYLKVIDGVATTDIVDWLVSRIPSNASIVLAATSVMDGVREHLRKECRGSRIVVIPDDIFHYSKGDEE